jgi:hypothetical protein
VQAQGQDAMARVDDQVARRRRWGRWEGSSRVARFWES